MISIYYKMSYGDAKKIADKYGETIYPESQFHPNNDFQQVDDGSVVVAYCDYNGNTSMTKEWAKEIASRLRDIDAVKNKILVYGAGGAIQARTESRMDR